MHALFGLKTRKYTFTLSILIGQHRATALVDTGSTTTFMTPAFATNAACPLFPSPKLKVTVANGATLWTEFTCHQCKYNIQGTPFTSNFRILQLKGYDIILGADWIYQHSPVTLDYKRMLLKATTNEEETVTFHDESLPGTSAITESYHLNKLLAESVCGAVLFIKPVLPTVCWTNKTATKEILWPYYSTYTRFQSCQSTTLSIATPTKECHGRYHQRSHSKRDHQR